MFVDGPEFFLVLAQLDTEGNILTKFQNNPTSGLGEDALSRNVYRRTVGRTLQSYHTVRKAPLDYDNIKKGPQIYIVVIRP